MTEKEFTDWFDSLDKGSRLRVMRIIVKTDFDVELDDEHPEIQKVRKKIKDQFLGEQH